MRALCYKRFGQLLCRYCSVCLLHCIVVQAPCLRTCELASAQPSKFSASHFFACRQYMYIDSHLPDALFFADIHFGTSVLTVVPLHVLPPGPRHLGSSLENVDALYAGQEAGAFALASDAVLAIGTPQANLARLQGLTPPGKGHGGDVPTAHLQALTNFTIAGGPDVCVTKQVRCWQFAATAVSSEHLPFRKDKEPDQKRSCASGVTSFSWCCDRLPEA